MFFLLAYKSSSDEHISMDEHNRATLEKKSKSIPSNMMSGLRISGVLPRSPSLQDTESGNWERAEVFIYDY